MRLRAALVKIPVSGVLVMTTYVLAPLLVVVGWVGPARARQPARESAVTR